MGSVPSSGVNIQMTLCCGKANAKHLKTEHSPSMATSSSGGCWILGGPIRYMIESLHQILYCLFTKNNEIDVGEVHASRVDSYKEVTS